MEFKKCIIALLAFNFVVSLAGIAVAREDEEVVVRGVGAIIDGNIAVAKKKAIADAQRRAVEQVAGVLVEGKTEIVNELMQNDRFYSQAKGFVKKYDILDVRQTGGLYEITIRALVSGQSIETSLSGLGIVRSRMNYPRVVILYRPNKDVVPDSAVSAEIALVKSFVERRFDVVDPAESRLLHREADELLKNDTIENIGARIGLKHYAEIVVFYRIGSQYTGNDGVIETAKSTLQTRVIVTTTAQIMATEEKSAIGIGTSKAEALRRSAAKIGQTESEYLIAQILAWWDDYTNNGIPYIIRLKMPKKADMLGITFREKLENLPNVTDLSMRFTGGGLFEVMVKYHGGTGGLRRALLQSLMHEKGFENLHTEMSLGRFIVLSVI